MSSLVSCLLRNCFDVGNEETRTDSSTSEDDEEEDRVPAPAPGSHFISRSNSIQRESSARRQSSASSGIGEDGHMEEITLEEEEVYPSCIHDLQENHHHASLSTIAEERNRHHHPLRSFMHRLGIHRDNAYDSIRAASIPPNLPADAASSSSRDVSLNSAEDASSSNRPTAPAAMAVMTALSQASSRFDQIRHSLSHNNPNKAIVVPTTDNTKSPDTPHLRLASSFTTTTSSSAIPTIHTNEIVLPGSILQKQMSASIKTDLGNPDEECVICMDGFDPTNPKMPTLCGCGENKTSFHLPCLYQWIDQNRNCPSCRKRLRWEEF